MRTLVAAVSPLALADVLFSNGGSNLFATPMTVASPSAFVSAPQQLEQMQYVNAVPYVQPVAYVEEAEPLSGSFYAVAGALVGGAVAVAATSQRGARSVSPQNMRAAEPMMFFSGDPNKYDPRVNFKGKKTASLLKTGKAAAKIKTKAAISTKRGGSTFVDVRGGTYQEVSTFVPQFDEVGVLPPLGRWDPLQIREQGPERYRRFVEMEIKHG